MRIHPGSPAAWHLTGGLKDGRATGTVSGIEPGSWHAIALSLNGSHITASVDGHTVATTASSAYPSGFAGIESSYSSVQFADLTIR